MKITIEIVTFSQILDHQTIFLCFSN